jgi:hypothetical protein
MPGAGGFGMRAIGADLFSTLGTAAVGNFDVQATVALPEEARRGPDRLGRRAALPRGLSPEAPGATEVIFEHPGTGSR